MKNYGTGSMLKAVQEILSESSLIDEAKHKILVGYAIDEAEHVLTQEQEAGREPHPLSWKAIRTAKSVFNGELDRVGKAAIAIHDTRRSLTIAACLDDAFTDSRPVYPSAAAAYDAGMAVLCPPTNMAQIVKDSVRSLLCVSYYAYTINIRKHGSTVARNAERACTDRHEADLRSRLL